MFMTSFADIPMIIKCLKDAKSIADTIRQRDKQVAVNEKASELFNIIINLQGHVSSLQSDLMSIQTEHNELLKTKNDIEKKLVKKEQWDITTSKYELKEVHPNTFVYALKENTEFPSEPTEPHHWICANCYSKQKKSILQHQNTKPGMLRNIVCPECKTIIHVMSDQFNN
jgi:hypothetical protein